MHAIDRYRKELLLFAGLLITLCAIGLGLIFTTGPAASDPVYDLETTVTATNGGFAWRCEEEHTAASDFNAHIVINTPENERGKDGFALDEGCTGKVDLTVEVLNGADCGKIHDGAHDLIVRGKCTITSKSKQSVHQDCVQVMGGTDVHLDGWTCEANDKTRAGAHGGGGTDSIGASAFINTDGPTPPTRFKILDSFMRVGGRPIDIGDSIDTYVARTEITRGSDSPYRCYSIDNAATNAVVVDDPLDPNTVTCVSAPGN